MFVIKDYLLHNGRGYKSNCKDLKQLFNCVDISSTNAALRSLQRVKIKTNEMAERLIGRARRLDRKEYKYELYANIDYESVNAYMVSFEFSETPVDGYGFSRYIPVLTTSDIKAALMQDVMDAVRSDLEEYKKEIKYER